MNRDLNPFDIVIGFGLGIAATFITLRLAGLIDNDVSIWGQVVLVPTMLLVIARHMNLPPFVTKQEREVGEKHNG